MGNASNSRELSPEEAQEIERIQNERIFATRGAPNMPTLDFSETSDRAFSKKAEDPKEIFRTDSVGGSVIPKKFAKTMEITNATISTQVGIGGSFIPDFENPIESISVAERSFAMIGLHHVMLSKAISEDDLIIVSDFIQAWLSSKDIPFQVQTTKGQDGQSYQQLYGYIFSECTYILFRMEFFRMKADQAIGLDVQQIEGEGFSLGTFFSELLSELFEQKFALPFSREGSVENETDLVEDYDFYSSDEESEDNDEDSSEGGIQNRYLELSRAPKVVNKWIKKLDPKTSFQDVLNTLLLFSHNCQHEDNLSLMIKNIQPQWASFLELLLNRMNGSANLPVVKSCCKILYHIFAKVPDFFLSWSDIATLCTVMEYWSTVQPFTYSHPVSICPEIQRYLAFVITSCQTPVDSQPKPHQLESILAMRNFVCPNNVRSDLNKFLDKLGV